MLTKIFFSWFLTYLPLAISGIMVLVVVINSLFPKRKYLLFLKKIKTTSLIYILVGLTLFFNIILSVLQYLVWRSSAFSRFFLPPYTKISYFLNYIFLHFWFATLLAGGFALALYLLLKLIKKYRNEAISQEELSLVLLSSLLVGWPKSVVLVPLFFLLTLIFSIVNLLFFKKKTNSLLYPIIFSLIIVFLLGAYLIKYLSLSVLIM